jgi:hypothetical protein
MVVPIALAFYLFPAQSIHLLAQSENAAATLAPWAVLFNTGVCGVWLWTMLTGKVHPHSEYQRVVTKLDAAEAEIRARNEDDRNTLIPALIRATDVLAQYVERRDNNTPPPPSKPPSRR